MCRFQKAAVVAAAAAATEVANKQPIKIIITQLKFL